MMLTQPSSPQLIAGDQGGRSIGAATCQTGCHRDPLGDLDRQAGGVLRTGLHCPGQRPCGSSGKVAAIRRHAVDPFTGDGHTVALGRDNSYLVKERDRVVYRRHIVVAVGADRAHGKLEVHLRRDTHGHSGNKAHDALMVAAWA